MNGWCLNMGCNGKMVIFMKNVVLQQWSWGYPKHSNMPARVRVHPARSPCGATWSFSFYIILVIGGMSNFIKPTWGLFISRFGQPCIQRKNYWSMDPSGKNQCNQHCKVDPPAGNLVYKPIQL